MGSQAGSTSGELSRPQSVSSLASGLEDDLSSMGLGAEDGKTISNLEKLIEHLQSENLDFRLRLGEQKERITSLEMRNEEHESNIDHLNWQIQLRNTQIKELNTSLRDILKIEPELRIEIEKLKCTIKNTKTDLEQSRKGLEWYKGQFYNLQINNRRHEDLICEKNLEISKLNIRQTRLQTELKKMMSHCETVEQSSLLEKTRMLQRIEELSFSQDSKDSGVFSELLSDFSQRNCSEVADLQSEVDKLQQEVKNCDEKLDLQIDYCQKLNVDKAKSLTEITALKSQLLMKDELFRLQTGTVEDLSKNVEQKIKDIEEKHKEILKLRLELSVNDQKLQILMKENVEMNRLSESMVNRFSLISSTISKLQKETCEKDLEIQKLKVQVPKRENYSQTSDHKSAKTSDQSIQVLIDDKPEAEEDLQKLGYYKSLAKVLEREFAQKIKQRDINLRTLLKTAQNHMRTAKSNERKRIRLEQEVLECLLKADSSLVKSNTPISETLKVFAENYKRLQYIPNEMSSQSLQDKKEMQQKCENLRSELQEKSKDLLLLQSKLESVQISLDSEVSKYEALLKAYKEKQHEIECFMKDLKIKDNLLEEMSSKVNSIEYELSQKSIQMKHQTQELTTLEQSSRLFQRQIEEERKELLSHLKSSQEQISSLHNEKLDLIKHSNHIQAILNNFLNRNRNSAASKSRAIEILEKCAKSNANLNPLEECVESLKKEVKNLNTTINKNRFFRREVSLMEELEGL